MHLPTLDILETNLKKELLPYYLLGSDELFLLKEARELIFRYALKQGFTQRTMLDFNDHFEWNQLYRYTTPDLFRTKSIIELHASKAISESTLNQFSHYLEQYLFAHLHQDLHHLIILTVEQSNKVLQKAKWFSLLSKRTRPFLLQKPSPASFSDWIKRQLIQNQILLTTEAFTQLIWITEGNLNAAHQNIEKLKLLAYSLDTASITKQQINDWLQNEAQFALSAFSQAIYTGECIQLVRVLTHLKTFNIEPVLVLGYLMKLIRVFSTLYYEINIQKTSIVKLLQQHNIWSTQQPFFKKAILQCKANDLKELFNLANRIDRCIKGAEKGSIWNHLEILSLRFAGYFSFNTLTSQNIE